MDAPESDVDPRYLLLGISGNMSKSKKNPMNMYTTRTLVHSVSQNSSPLAPGNYGIDHIEEKNDNFGQTYGLSKRRASRFYTNILPFNSVIQKPMPKTMLRWSREMWVTASFAA